MLDVNFGDAFDALGTALGDRSAIVHGHTTRSWAEFDARSNRLARALLDAGLTTDSKVAFYLRNTPAYLELYAACTKARCVHANINYRYVEDELHEVLAHVDAEAVVYEPDFAPQAARLRTRLPQVRLWIENAGSTAQPRNDFAASFEGLCAHGDGTALAIQRSPEDLTFMYTGGTTGRPKAVMWRQGDRIEVIGMTEGRSLPAHMEAVAATDLWPVTIPAAPLMHSTGITSALSALMRGGTVVLLPSAGFNPAECLAEIGRNRATHLAIVGDAFCAPLIDELRLHANQYDLSSLSTVTSAGAIWSEARKRELLEYLPHVTLTDSLGSSEGSRLAGESSRHGDPTRTARFTLSPGARVFTEDGREVVPGSGEAGRIATTGPIPLGYYKDEEATGRTFPIIDGVRWSIPGDWCTVDADRTLHLLGRGSNCVNSGGEKIWPEEVEEALKLCDGVRDAAVTGVADDRWGQAVAAVVQTHDGKPLDVDTLRSALERYLARYKHPRHWLWGAEGLRFDNGKMNYREIRRRLTAAGWQT